MQKELEDERKLRIEKEGELEIEKARSKKMAQSKVEEEKRQHVSTTTALQKKTKLEKEIEGLRIELAKCQLKLNPNMEDNFTLNPMTATFEAKSGQEIQGSLYIDEIIARIREQINDKLNPGEILRAYAKYEPTIMESEFLMPALSLELFCQRDLKTF